MTKTEISQAEQQVRHNMERSGLALLGAGLMMSASLSGQTIDENQTSAQRKKAKIEQLKTESSLDVVLQGESQYTEKLTNLFQSVCILNVGIEQGKWFAGMNAMPCITNGNEDDKFESCLLQLKAMIGRQYKDGRFILSAGKIRRMNDYCSPATMTNMGLRDNKNIGLGVIATVDKGVQLEWQSNGGDKIALGYFENSPDGFLFNFTGKDGSVYLLGNKTLIKNRLSVAGGIDFKDDKSVSGFTAVRCRPDGKTTVLLEATNIGTKEAALIATMNRSLGNALVSVNGYLQKNNANTSLSLHFKNGVWLGCGYDRAEGKGSMLLSAGFTKCFGIGGK